MAKLVQERRNITQEKRDRATELKRRKEISKRRVEDGLRNAKSSLIGILSDMEECGSIKRFHKLNVIISKIEGLQNEL